MAYGQELVLDLHGCDVSTFTRGAIGDYFDRLCALINMEAEDRHFWDDEDVPPHQVQTDPKTTGISAVQFILTSSIVVHALTLLGNVYVNVFSCAEFDAQAVESFTKDFFGASECHSQSLKRH